jgi:hypothetical protein
VDATVPVPDSSLSTATAASDPDDGLDRRIVRTDLGIACATFVTATLLSTTADALLPLGWWFVPLVALGWATLTAASDRSRAGLYALFGAGALATLGIVWWVANGADPRPAIPLLLYGLGLGAAANRLLFGVVRPVPALRRERERS